MGARNIMRLLNEALQDGDRFDLISGGALKVLPQTDDTGLIQFGDGTYDCDVVWYAGDTSTKVTFDKGATQLTLAGVNISSNSDIVTSGALQGGASTVSSVSSSGKIQATGNGFVAAKKLVTEATAARAVTAADYDSIIELTGGAGATTVTLPDPAAANLGAKVTVVSLSNHAHVVALADKLIALTSIAGDSLTAAESDKTGQTVTLVSDGAKWVVVAMTGAWTVAAA